ncbi:hypothetical protein L2E82_41391 [Cichorium intybus]|uniref:Uncharacterized protein n=1 Tax=Cichorium intybus TaxID=13427 RepID=A0ACB9AN59_CICIN|nr:hypothetical protein L2E82_41391 [Cichorium intybus]
MRWFCSSDLGAFLAFMLLGVVLASLPLVLQAGAALLFVLVGCFFALVHLRRNWNSGSLEVVVMIRDAIGSLEVVVMRYELQEKVNSVEARGEILSPKFSALNLHLSLQENPDAESVTK